MYFLLFDFPRDGGIQHRGCARLGLLPAEGCLNCEDQWKVWEAPLGDGGDLGVPVHYTFVHQYFPGEEQKYLAEELVLTCFFYLFLSFELDRCSISEWKALQPQTQCKQRWHSSENCGLPQPSKQLGRGELGGHNAQVFDQCFFSFTHFV